MQTTDSVDSYITEHKTQFLSHHHYVAAQKPRLDEFLEPILGELMVIARSDQL